MFKDGTDLKEFMDFKYGERIDNIEPIYKRYGDVILYYGVRKKK